VLWVTNLAPPYRRALWDALVERADLTVATLATTKQNREAWAHDGSEGYRAHQLRPRVVRRGASEYFLLSEGDRALVRQRWDVVSVGSWSQPAYWRAITLAKSAGGATLARVGATERSIRSGSGLGDQVRRRFLRRADAVLTYGRASRDLLVDRLGLGSDVVVAGFNAVDDDAIASRATIARRDVPASTSHRFVYVGQLIPRKNVQGLLRAFAAVRRPGDELTIVGQGEERMQLERLASELGVTGTVTFAGPLAYDDAIDVMLESQTLVLPSHREVWGLVVNEARAGGLHVVVTDRCGAAADFQADDLVWTCETDDRSLARALEASRRAWLGWNPSGIRQLALSADRTVEAIALAIERSERR
jgi:glycosyltransferase involved in cell wall biosynthesis